MGYTFFPAQVFNCPVSWDITHESATQGYNTATFVGSPFACMIECTKRTDFTCVGFDYNYDPPSDYCFLSDTLAAAPGVVLLSLTDTDLYEQYIPPQCTKGTLSLN